MAALLLGLVCRVAQYVADRSFWVDEASVVLNIREKTAHELFGPLKYNQAAPPLFLAAERGLYHLFGGSELSLRALPFTCGILALLLFTIVARRVLRSPWDALAVLLFGTSDMLIWHATEVKQYGTDAFMAVLMLLIALPRRGEESIAQRQTVLPRPRPANRYIRIRFALLCALGIVSVWFSYPSAIVFGALSLAMLPIGRLRPRRERASGEGPDPGPGLGTYLLGNVLVAASFAIVVFTVVRAQQNAALNNYWAQEFIDWKHPLTLPWWLVRHLHALCNYPVQLAGPVTLAVAVLGCVALVRGGRVRTFIMLAGPIGLALLAAAVHRYPFDGARLTSFLEPGVLLLVAIGLQALPSGTGVSPVSDRIHSPAMGEAPMPRNSGAGWLSVLPAAFILVIALYWAGLHLIFPRTRGHLRPIAEYLQTHAQPGDGLYVQNENEWLCYWPADDHRLRFGVDRADQIPFQRFWLILSFPHQRALHRFDPVLKWAGQFAIRRDTHVDPRGGAAFLFERKDGALPESLDPPSTATHHRKMSDGAEEEP